MGHPVNLHLIYKELCSSHRSVHYVYSHDSTMARISQTAFRTHFEKSTSWRHAVDHICQDHCIPFGWRPMRNCQPHHARCVILLISIHEMGVAFHESEQDAASNTPAACLTVGGCFSLRRYFRWYLWFLPPTPLSSSRVLRRRCFSETSSLSFYHILHLLVLTASSFQFLHKLTGNLAHILPIPSVVIKPHMLPFSLPVRE